MLEKQHAKSIQNDTKNVLKLTSKFIKILKKLIEKGHARNDVEFYMPFRSAGGV